MDRVKGGSNRFLAKHMGGTGTPTINLDLYLLPPGLIRALVRADMQLNAARSLLTGKLHSQKVTVFVCHRRTVVLVNGPFAILSRIDSQRQCSPRNLGRTLSKGLQRENGSLSHKDWQHIQTGKLGNVMWAIDRRLRRKR